MMRVTFVDNLYNNMSQSQRHLTRIVHVGYNLWWPFCNQKIEGCKVLKLAYLSRQPTHWSGHTDLH